MLIVFLDTGANKIVVGTDTGIKILNFEKVEMLRTMAKNQSIFYVTSVMETNANSIIDTVQSIAPDLNYSRSLPDVSKPDVAPINKTLYLHSTSKGTLNIPELKDVTSKNGDLTDLTFRSIDEAYSVETLKTKFGADVFERYSAFNSLLEKGILEIIDGTTLAKIRKEYTGIISKYDQSLNSILVNTDSKNKARDATVLDSGNGSSAVEVDVSAATSFRKADRNPDYARLGSAKGKKEVDKNIDVSKIASLSEGELLPDFDVDGGVEGGSTLDKLAEKLWLKGRLS